MKHEPDRLMNKIIQCDSEIESLEEERSKLLHQWAELDCPFNVGDETKCVGYSFNGKPCVVKSIQARQNYNGTYGWLVRVKILKKDGSVSKHESDFTDSQYAADQISKQVGSKDIALN